MGLSRRRGSPRRPDAQLELGEVGGVVGRREQLHAVLVRVAAHELVRGDHLSLELLAPRPLQELDPFALGKGGQEGATSDGVDDAGGS